LNVRTLVQHFLFQHLDEVGIGPAAVRVAIVEESLFLSVTVSFLLGGDASNLVISVAVAVDLVDFLHWLTLFHWRGRLPDIWIFEGLFLSLIAAAGFGPVRAEPSVGGSEVAFGDAEGAFFIVDGVVGRRKGPIVTGVDDTGIIEAHAWEHGLDILCCFFLLDDVGLEAPIVFKVFSWDVIEDDLLFDRIDDFCEAFDGFIVLAKIAIVASLLDVETNLLDFILHWSCGC
jgi:hypothetical protein